MCAFCNSDRERGTRRIVLIRMIEPHPLAQVANYPISSFPRMRETNGSCVTTALLDARLRGHDELAFAPSFPAALRPSVLHQAEDLVGAVGE